MQRVITAAQMSHHCVEFTAATTAWATANGIDPTTVTAHRAIVVIGDEIQYHEVCEDENGRTIFDETGPFGTEVATVLRTVPLIVPMPETWPLCENCAHNASVWPERWAEGGSPWWHCRREVAGT